MGQSIANRSQPTSYQKLNQRKTIRADIVDTPAFTIHIFEQESKNKTPGNYPGQLHQFRRVTFVLCSNLWMLMIDPIVENDKICEVAYC